MDLYRKKVNIGNKSNRRAQDRYPESDYNPSKKKQNIYIQKMIPQNENLASSGENIPNVRSSMEDIFSNEDSKKKAIKYVINLGKNRNIHNSPKYRTDRRFEKSASPNRGRGYPVGYENSYENTPNRPFPNRRGESHLNNRLSTLNDYTPITYTGYNNARKRNNVNSKLRNYGPYNDIDEEYYDNQPNNYLNAEESQNDYEFSSMNDDDRIPKFRNVEPKMLHRVKSVLNETYERAAKRVRDKEIKAMQNMRRNPINTYTNTNINNNYNDDDVDELIKTVEDLQSIINGQKNQLRNIKKDKEDDIKYIQDYKNQMQQLLDEEKKEKENKRKKEKELCEYQKLQYEHK